MATVKSVRLIFYFVLSRNCKNADFSPLGKHKHFLLFWRKQIFLPGKYQDFLYAWYFSDPTAAYKSTDMRADSHEKMKCEEARWKKPTLKCHSFLLL